MNVGAENLSVDSAPLSLSFSFFIPMLLDIACCMNEYCIQHYQKILVATIKILFLGDDYQFKIQILRGDFLVCSGLDNVAQASFRCLIMYALIQQHS